MDEALAFFEKYAKAVYQTRIAYLSERDADKWKAALAALQEVTISGGYIDGENRLASPDESWFADFEPEAAGIKERKIFQIKQYDHEDGPLFRAYTTSDSGDFWDKLYDRNWFAQKVDGAFKVVGHAVYCTDCRALGDVDGKPCGNCDGLGWEWFSGGEIAFTGPPTAVKKIFAPVAPPFLKEYERE